MTEKKVDFEVGYGKPPIAKRFQPGKSGNPRGKTPGTRNLNSDLLDELREIIPIREGGRELRVSKQRAFVKTLVAKALKGDGRASAVLVGLCAKAFGVEQAKPTLASKAEVGNKILERFVEREITRRANAAAASPVEEGDSDG